MESMDLSKMGLPSASGLGQAIGAREIPSGLMAALRGHARSKPKEEKIASPKSPDAQVQENQGAGGNNSSR